MACVFADCSFTLSSNRKLMLVSPRTSQPMFLPQSFQNGTSVLSVDILFFRIFFFDITIFIIIIIIIIKYITLKFIPHKWIVLFANAEQLASSEVISQVLFTTKQPKKNKMASHFK